ncbi:hypothetical protein AWZ03_013507 [Drosophila navojoa]|uniref:SAM domain-containing protein n=1 Tax=Drosophila navojoa TaxID=7232 RepID=A0A484AWZ8_DRONA|nr:uncharacterized protein LOC108650573 [Drosophila navojoa]TDG40075.1 hypothetical protein AWZ03_013507 [Drosophila navojoa]
MDRYNRAWRDPRSPLTPITPLTTRAFSFDNIPSPPTPNPCKSQSYNSRGLRPNHHSVQNQTAGHARRLIGSCTPKHFSQDFMRIRSVFSPCAHGTAIQGDSAPPKKDTRSSQLTDAITKQAPPKRHFKRSSPVNQPELSPRVSSLLNRTGNNHLLDLFRRQEIDMAVLVQMTLEELESLGVRGVRELKLAIDVIKFAKKFI